MTIPTTEKLPRTEGLRRDEMKEPDEPRHRRPVDTGLRQAARPVGGARPGKLSRYFGTLTTDGFVMCPDPGTATRQAAKSRAR